LPDWWRKPELFTGTEGESAFDELSRALNGDFGADCDNDT
jgi:hypothetical protein